MTSHGAVKDIDILHGFNKDEMGYFVNEFTPEAFEVWAAERKTQMIDRLSEEDLERVTSFLNDAKGKNTKGTAPCSASSGSMQLTSEWRMSRQTAVESHIYITLHPN